MNDREKKRVLKTQDRINIAKKLDRDLHVFQGLRVSDLRKIRESLDAEQTDLADFSRLWGVSEESMRIIVVLEF